MFREMFYLLSRSVDHWDEDRNNSMCKVIDWDEYDQEKMDAWQNGQTGFPLIDSMMRQLSTTGWMHHLEGMLFLFLNPWTTLAALEIRTRCI